MWSDCGQGERVGTASKDGYVPQSKAATTTVDFDLALVPE